MWLSRYVVYFAVYSVMGWIYETIYVTARTGKWDNRGFLMGPVVPIYGVGGVTLTVLLDYIDAYTEIQCTWWQIFLVSMFGSMILEYSTSWALEKLFHARWWDYSWLPLNLNGRICLPYSVAFGAAGLLVAYEIAPFTRSLLDWMTPILYELFSMIFVAVISADATLTASALTDFDDNVVSLEENMNARMSEIVENLEEKRAFAGEALAESAEILRSGDKEAIERFLSEQLEISLGHMGVLRRKALSRVESFNKESVSKVQIQTTLNSLMQKRKNKKAKMKAEKSDNRKADREAADADLKAAGEASAAKQENKIEV